VCGYTASPSFDSGPVFHRLLLPHFLIGYSLTLIFNPFFTSPGLATPTFLAPFFFPSPSLDRPPPNITETFGFCLPQCLLYPLPLRARPCVSLTPPVGLAVFFMRRSHPVNLFPYPPCRPLYTLYDCRLLRFVFKFGYLRSVELLGVVVTSGLAYLLNFRFRGGLFCGTFNTTLHFNFPPRYP